MENKHLEFDTNTSKTICIFNNSCDIPMIDTIMGSSCLKCKIYDEDLLSEYVKKEYKVVFGERGSVHPQYCKKCNPKDYKELPEFSKQFSITEITECSSCRNIIYEHRKNN